MNQNKAFIIIATGKPAYGEMALSLCLSIKSNSNYPVILFYTDSAVESIGTRISHFDHSNRLIFTHLLNLKSPIQEAFYAKLIAYELVKQFPQYTEFIILDADTMVLPGKKLDDWWKQNEDRTFNAYFNNSTKEDASWCNVEEAKKHYSVEPDRKLPQVNASFIYFLISDRAKLIFDTALIIWNDDTFTGKPYRGSKTEEMCFNIALSVLRYHPKQVPYRPLWMQCNSEIIDEVYIQHRFNAFTMAGHINHDHRIVSLYNRLSDYYRGQFGIKAIYHFNQEIKVAKEPRKIYGYWHVAMMGNWYKVVKEQMALLVKHGLYDASETIYVCCLGDASDYNKLELLLCTKYKFVLLHEGFALNQFEFPTLKRLKEGAESFDPHFGFYIHTKGVSDPRGAHWRDFLNHFNIVEWKQCQHRLRQGFDLCGVKLIQAGAHPMHYSGNFWHFDSDYIKTLKKIESLNHHNRFEAEFWVASGQPNAATLNQTLIDHYNHTKFKPTYLETLKSKLWEVLSAWQFTVQKKIKKITA